MVVDLPLEGGLSTKGLGLPFQLSETPSSIRRPPPALGAHTHDVLLELGLSDAEIDELSRRGVI
jgi:crotonobetainyl-CoA:carnitine CoA-transferase CaiB-like acyl-CoA transferase